MAVDKKPAVKTAAKAPAKTATPAAAQKKVKKPISKAVNKLLSHRSTRPLLAKLRKDAKKKNVAVETLIKRRPQFVVKKVGGDKNGGTRLVPTKKPRKFYPTEDTIRKRRTGHQSFKTHKRTFKSGIEAGRVVIVLAGRHKGKRVVVLKTLPSGLILVTGPHVINGVPIRRMHQQFVIVTSTKLNLSGVKVPATINDKYFKRHRDSNKKSKSKKSDGGDIFEAKAEAYKPTEQRKKDQIEVDKQIVDVVRKNPDKKLLFSYLGSYFQLRNRVYPHKLKF